MSTKIYKIEDFIRYIAHVRGDKSVGLITGSFDMLHAHHIKMFEFAKENVDMVLVGLDTDIAVKRSKGNSRPTVRQEDRARVLSTISHIDYVLLLDSVHAYSTSDANWYHDNLVYKLKPTHLITDDVSDPFWRIKEKRIKKVGGELLLHKRSEKERKSNPNLVVRLS